MKKIYIVLHPKYKEREKEYKKLRDELLEVVHNKCPDWIEKVEARQGMLDKGEWRII